MKLNLCLVRDLPNVVPIATKMGGPPQLVFTYLEVTYLEVIIISKGIAYLSVFRNSGARDVDSKRCLDEW